MTLRPADTITELRRFAHRLAFHAPRSAMLLHALADALHHDASLAGLTRADAAMSRPMAGVRILAGLHDLVLAGKAPALHEAMYPPNLDTAPLSREALWRLARQAITDHSTAISAALDWPVQQHTPERAGLLL